MIHNTFRNSFDGNNYGNQLKKCSSLNKININKTMKKHNFLFANCDKTYANFYYVPISYMYVILNTCPNHGG